MTLEVRAIWARGRALIRLLARDRLTWFALLGGFIFFADIVIESTDDSVITIDAPLVAKLAAQWEGQMGRPPGPADLDALVTAHIREEVLVRAAVARGLDQDDPIIRRRLAQKMTFLMADDVSDAPAPSASDLRQFFEANPEMFVRPPRFSFQHIFLGEEGPAAVALGRSLRDQLVRDPTIWRGLGRSFMLQRAYAARTADEIARIFGADFAKLVTESGSDAGWSGPIGSAYGAHLVRVTDRQPEMIPPFDNITARVTEAYDAARRRAANRAAFDALRAQYQLDIVPAEAEQ